MEQVVDITPRESEHLARVLSNLGVMLGRRFERTGAMIDLNRALSCYEEDWSCRTSPPPVRKWQV